MFGHIKKTVEKAAKPYLEKSRQQKMAAQELKNQQEEAALKNRANESVQQAKEERQKARQEGRQYGEELFSRDVEGLNPKERQMMQYEAGKQARRSYQSANRKLLGEQGMRGIMPKSGVGYAQQSDLMRMSQENENQALRDIDKLNYDLKMKKLAAMFNVEQGEAAQSQLDRQIAMDELRLEQERKRQKDFEDKFYQQFMRV